jgi:D-arginine dehydrogenase
VDVAALLEGYLRGAAAAGVRLKLVAGGRLRRCAGRWIVETRAGRIETPIVVNAAGAWARAVAREAGASDLPVQPFRRHLVASAPTDAVDVHAPYLWDVSHGLYFRPESGGLLLSACDETAAAADACAIDPSVAELLAHKVERFMPRLADLSVLRMWAGLRTLTPDRNFVVGPDPNAEGFIWCAGLGGHGVTASAAVGRMAADAVVGRATPAAHAPGRFQPQGNK